MSNTEKRSAPEPTYPVSSVDNALRLLSVLRSRRTLRVTDAADALGVARSTAHRLLAMLAHHEFVVQDPTRRTYSPGPELIRIGLAAVLDIDIRGVARQSLESLRDAVDETVHLCTLRGASVLYLDCVESGRLVRVGARTGSVSPAFASAAGKAMLATLPVAQVREMYGAAEPGAVSPPSLGDLQEELALARVDGYTVSWAEPDLVAVGAAVPDPTGTYRAAVSVAAPRSRTGDAELARFAEEARRWATRIGADLSLAQPGT